MSSAGQAVAVHGEFPEGLREAFWRYEAALMQNRLDVLDELFAPGPDTLRGDLGGLLVGHDRISAFRAVRGGAPERAIDSVHVRPIDADHVLLVAVTRALAGGVGQQTQLWQRFTEGWKVTAAQVSATPATALDASIWRVAGTPLVAGLPEGPLAGETVAVKDLFQVAGFLVGGGVPAYLAEQEPAAFSAPAVTALLDAGASVVGIARTDEFAYSIAGRNPHYGTPPNPRVTGGLPGGSSSGPASAVALGHASIGLGTDTGGSIRVPASYQGLWGLRTTHGLVDRAGLLPLAPSYDTVGWLTRSPAVLAAAARVSIPAEQQRAAGSRLAVVDLTTAGLTAEVTAEFARALSLLRVAARELGLVLEEEAFDPGDLAALAELYRRTQAEEAWRVHGEWIQAHPGGLGTEIGARFETARQLAAEGQHAARARVAEVRAELAARAEGRILLLPSASSAAPDAKAAGPEVEAARATTMRLTCLAGVLGRPVVAAPLMTLPAGPLGLSLAGERGTDVALVELAAALDRETPESLDDTRG